MRRISDREQYQRHQRSRARYEAKRRAERRLWLGRRASRQLDFFGLPFDPSDTGRSPLTSLHAPKILSMADNPALSIEFFARLLDRLAQRRMVHVVLRDVQRIDFDAIVVLLSIMVRFKVAGLRFNGDRPQNDEASQFLGDSGFFSVLFNRGALREQSAYEFALTEFTAIGRTQVDPLLSSELIRRATKKLHGVARRVQGMQRVFLELMQNTFDHASPEGDPNTHWWASFHYDKPGRRVRFVFVDLGIGVFGSLDQKTEGNRWHGWRSRFERSRPNSDVLRAILEGDLRLTMTGEEHRGKGLPSIKTNLDRGWFANLLLITNNVFADVSRSSYKTLSAPFRGTFISWEINLDCQSCPQ